MQDVSIQNFAPMWSDHAVLPNYEWDCRVSLVGVVLYFMQAIATTPLCRRKLTISTFPRSYVGVVGRLKLIDEKLISACLRCAGMDRQVQSSMVQWSEDTVVPGPAYPQPALWPGDQTKNTTALWKLAGEENNLSYLIPLLKKYKEHVPEKHYIVSLLLSRSILRYCGMAPYAVLHLDWTNIITMCLFIR